MPLSQTVRLSYFLLRILRFTTRRPDNWARSDNTFGTNWLSSHANLSQIVLQKPLVVEEFGKAYGGDTIATGQGQTQQQQVDYYKLVYSIVEQSFDSNGVIGGIGFWRWGAAISNDLAPFDNAATISKSSPPNLSERLTRSSQSRVWTLGRKFVCSNPARFISSVEAFCL